jgi:lysophospholipase L1-like esterase
MAALAVAIVAAACASRAPRHLVCLGDSNTSAGWPAPEDIRWCEMLGEFPELAGTRIDNLARGGAELRREETAWPNADLQLDMARALGRPDVIVLAFGTNDIRTGRSPRAVAHGYAALTRRAEAAGAIVYTALTPPVHWPLPDAEKTNAKVDELNALLRASVAPGRLLDFHTGFTAEYFDRDGLHVNAEGQRKRALVARAALLADRAAR